MVRPERELLSGVVELDETFAGGRSTGRMGASTGKIPVMVAVERIGSHKLGRVRFGIDYAPGSLELVSFAQRTIAPGSTISADGVLSLPEIRHLLVYLIFTQPPNPKHILSRSRWRRRHQQTAKRHHY